VTIDWSLSLGNIITIIGLLVGGLAFAFRIDGTVSRLKDGESNTVDRISAVERDLSKITDVLVTLARQDERLNSHADRIRSLEESVGRVHL
jgi:hypothetical protein